MEKVLDYELLAIGNFHLKVANILVVLVIWLATHLLLRLIKRLINRGLTRLAWDQGRRHSLFLIAQYFVWILAITAMIESLGVRVSVLVASSAAILVGLGLGVQLIFRDIVSGIFLLIEGTIEVGDIIMIENKVARVTQINLRTTEVTTRDGISFILPNSRFITESVQNWSHHNDNSAIQFQVQVYVRGDSNEQVVRSLLLDSAAAQPDIIQETGKQPTVRLLEFREESAVLFQIVFWSARKFDAENLLSDLRFEIRKRLREQGIELGQ
jgi:small-conductance mechanosensitive channel